jgi:small subunit ribosomal protein S17
VPEKKTTATKKTTTRRVTKATAASGEGASGRAARPRRPAAKAGTAASKAAVSERRVPSAAPLARSRRKTRVGRVVSAKTPKTVIVEIERMREHPLYKKVIRVRKRVPAHDATGEVKAGDLVRIQESRPFSATKRWQVAEVMSRAGEAYAAAPQAADIERALEETEGVTELLAKPEREAAEASAEEADAAAEDDEEERA